MKMKNILILCGMAVLLTSCKSVPLNIQESESATEQSISAAAEETTEESTVPAEAVGLSYAITEEENSFAAEDGTEVLKVTYTYPQLAGSETSVAPINEDVSAHREDFWNDASDNFNYAKEDYAYRIDELGETAGQFFPYEMQMDTAVTRNDEAVFSFTQASYSFTGGAHGYGETKGYNYDTMTGQQIFLKDLSEDESSWKENILSYVQEKCQTEEYKERLFEDYESYLADVVFEDDNWYFTGEGLAISCAPYTLGCYAAGSIEFLIPYENLKAYGLKDCYAN